MKSLLVFIAIIGSTITFAQTTWYVSATGSNSNSGLSAGAAFATVNQAISVSACGDSIYILGGTYHEKMNAYPICPDTDRIVIQGDISNRPLIIGDSLATNKYAISASGQGFTFRHLELTSPYPTICSQSNMVVVGSGDDMSFIDLIVRNGGYDGIKTTSDCTTSTWPNNWKIIDCQVYNNGLGCPTSIQNGDGIDLTECHDCQIIGTTIRDNMGHQIQVKLEARNVTIEQCHIEGKLLFQIGLKGATPQCDVLALNADSVYIRHNIIVAKGDTSEFVFRLSDVSNLVIENNTIVKDNISSANVGFICFGGCAGGSAWTYTPLAPVLIRNNIFANMSTTPFYAGPDTTYYDPFGTVAANVTGNYNVFYDVNGLYTSPVDGGAASMVADPLFCDYPNSFDLSSTSPCIDAGDPASPLDPDNSQNDIGAKYYQTPCEAGLIQSIHPSHSLAVYPNPFSTYTIVQTDKSLQSATLTVLDCFGQTVQQLNNLSGQSFVLSRDNLASGMYFMQLLQDGEVIGTEKIIISDH